jgi:hypothetical protein
VREPILGPKTKEEVEEEETALSRQEYYMKTYLAKKRARESARKPVKETEAQKWTPKWEDMFIAEEDQPPSSSVVVLRLCDRHP